MRCGAYGPMRGGAVHMVRSDAGLIVASKTVALSGLGRKWHENADEKTR